MRTGLVQPGLSKDARPNTKTRTRIDTPTRPRLDYDSLTDGSVRAMRKILLVSLFVVALILASAVYVFWSMGKPGSWGFQIAQFEMADRVHPPKQGTIVFTGSSSIRFWYKLEDDMKPLEVINRGFGGSQIAQVNEYASKIILPYRPRAVVLYAGENDLSPPWSKSPEQVFADFRQFVEIIQSKLPETWIYYISIKPSPLRWGNWEKMKRTNALIKNYSETQARVQYIDVDAAMLDVQGKPRADLFRWDGLHMNSKGYAIWTSMVKAVLLSRFAAVKENPLRWPLCVSDTRERGEYASSSLVPDGARNP